MIRNWKNKMNRVTMKARRHENRFPNAVARVPRRAGSISPLRQCNAADSCRSALHACAPRARIQKEVFGESESARPKAEGQALDLGPRFPRQGTLERRFSYLAGEFRIGEPLADDLTNANIEALGIGHLAVVESKRLLVNVAEQVERLNTDVGSMQATLQETPEVFHHIGMNVAVRVLDSMVDNCVLIIFAQTFVRLQFVGEDRRASFDVLPYLVLKFPLATIIYNEGSHIAAALYHAHNYGLILAASSSDNALTFRLVHVARFAADKSFVHLDFTCELAAMLALLSETDAVQHEPSGLLSHPKRLRNFATANTVLAVEYQPHCRKPLVQTERRILEDGSNLHRKLPPWMTDATLPAQLILQEANAGTPAPWADDAVLPLRATGDKIAQAVLLIREVQDCFLQGLWFVSVCHALIVRQNRVLVNYIFALLWFHEPRLHQPRRFLHHLQFDRTDPRTACPGRPELREVMSTLQQHRGLLGGLARRLRSRRRPLRPSFDRRQMPLCGRCSKVTRCRKAEACCHL